MGWMSGWCRCFSFGNFRSVVIESETCACCVMRWRWHQWPVCLLWFSGVSRPGLCFCWCSCRGTGFGVVSRSIQGTNRQSRCADMHIGKCPMVSRLCVHVQSSHRCSILWGRRGISRACICAAVQRYYRMTLWLSSWTKVLKCHFFRFPCSCLGAKSWWEISRLLSCCPSNAEQVCRFEAVRAWTEHELLHAWCAGKTVVKLLFETCNDGIGWQALLVPI